MDNTTKLLALRQVVKVLADEFKEITPEQVYLVPLIDALAAGSSLELQVCEGGSEYPDHMGDVVREDFLIEIGILRKTGLDGEGKFAAALAVQAVSLFNYKGRVINVLDGNFLQTSIQDASTKLLTRPLIILREHKAYCPRKATGTLIKVLVFSGGLNTDWERDNGRWT
jgi:hypothetical protein